MRPLLWADPPEWPAQLRDIYDRIGECIPMNKASIVKPREPEITMARDWEWVQATLRMVQDRALTGTPLHLRRPAWFGPQVDVKATMKSAVVAMIDDIFATAIIDEPEDAAKPAP